MIVLPPISMGAVVVLAVVVLLMSGCGDDSTSNASASAGAASPAPVIDSRFASADGLINHINSLASKGHLTLLELADLAYAENDAQRQHIDIIRQLGLAQQCDEAAITRFGVPMNVRGDYRVLARFENVRLKSAEARRATATLRDTTWRLSQLMLVEIGGRWWISVYSWGETGERIMLESIKQVRPFLEVGVPVEQAIAPRIRAGEFKTIDEARRAYFEWMNQYLQQHPDPHKRWLAAGGQPGLQR
jgi:hypothetical protein